MTSTRNRSEDDKAKVRKAMLEAAGELLVEQGYEGLTITALGKKVGFTATNVYRYFDTKDDLIYAAIEEAFVEFGQRLEEAYHNSDDPLTRILALGRAYVAFAEEHPVPYELMFVLKTDYLFTERELPGVDKLAYIVQALGEAMAVGAVRQGDPQTMANTLWGLMHGVITLSAAMPFIDEQQKKGAIEEAFTVMSLSLKP